MSQYLSPAYSTFYMAEPINGMFITPWPDEGDDFCLYCAREIRVSPHGTAEAYWFHLGTFMKNCREAELIRVDEL